MTKDETKLVKIPKLPKGYIAVHKDFCAFCAGHDKKVGPLVGRDGMASICYRCAQAACEHYERQPEVLNDHQERQEQCREEDLSGMKRPAPREVFAQLSLNIVGQDKAKRILSNACVDHIKGIVARATNRNVHHDKQNILLVGPTGVGKTALAKSLAHTLGVPFAIGDATTLTEAGYVGEDVENLLLKLIQAADGDIAAAERGVLYIDEADKLGKKTGNVSITRDVSGEGVQQGLLKLIEGTIANVPPQGGRKHPEQKFIRFDTSNVLFILGGTFDGGGGNSRIEEIVKQRLGKRKIGFDAKTSTDAEQIEYDILRSQITPEDLIQFGMIPELVGRVPIIAPLHSLSVKDMVRILTEPTHAIIKQYIDSFEMDGVILRFAEDGLFEIAQQAYDRKLGARALQAVLAEIMEDLKFTLESYKGKTVLVSAESVRSKQFKISQIKKAA